jgi:uncharacterized protein DUF4058
MPPVRSIKNQYHGINAHLHSFWQAKGGWDAFHANHITYLTAALTARLLPMGYIAENQQSLQIRRYGEPAGKPKSDVTIYDTQTSRLAAAQTMPAQQTTVKISDLMTLEDEIDDYRAVGIYEFAPGQSDLGEPVAWIELLSPSSKPGGQDGDYYQHKQYKLLKSGIVFVELDYLHESSPTFDRVPPYIASQKSAASNRSHAYRIVVIDPRPVFFDGLGYRREFDVDMVIPQKVDIPLNAGDVLTFDFNAPYQRTFEEHFYGWEQIDYSQLPLNFDRYSPDDQSRIAARMLAVLKAARDGVDLEANAPLPVAEVQLDDALAQINMMDVKPST